MTVIKIPSLEKGLAQAELSIDEYWLIYSIIFAQRISLDSDPFNNGGFGSIFNGTIRKNNQPIIAKVVLKNPDDR